MSTLSRQLRSRKPGAKEEETPEVKSTAPVKGGVSKFKSGGKKARQVSLMDAFKNNSSTSPHSSAKKESSTTRLSDIPQDYVVVEKDDIVLTPTQDSHAAPIASQATPMKTAEAPVVPGGKFEKKPTVERDDVALKSGSSNEAASQGLVASVPSFDAERDLGVGSDVVEILRSVVDDEAIASASELNSLKVEESMAVFDLEQTYGPSAGLSRARRWVRAHKFGLEPPALIGALLVLEHENSAPRPAITESIWSGRI